MTKDAELLVELINKKTKLTAMLAPSFPIAFEYPTIISSLRKLGFTYVVEVALGAQKTNEQLKEFFEKNPEARCITSPCPTIVRMIKKTMPQYTKYLSQGIDSPMVATAKIVREKYPGYKPIFIGPCVMKKMEANEDVPELEILAVTYIELQEALDHFKIGKEVNPNEHFDLAAPGLTMMYAVDGGLSHSSSLFGEMGPEKVKIVSGAQNNIAAIKEFDQNPNIKLLDILNCPGGCIGGPGIKSELNAEQRKQKIVDYYQAAGV